MVPRRALSVAAIMTLTSLVACAPGEPQPSPPPGPASGGAACQPVEIKVGEVTSTARVLTWVRRVTIGNPATGIPGDSVVVRNHTEAPSIQWSTAGMPTELIRRQLSEQGSDITLETYTGMVSGERIMSDLPKKTGTYIGYASVRRKVLPITAMCADGQALTGILTTWDQPETGLVECGLNVGDGAPAAAVQAEREFC